MKTRIIKTKIWQDSIFKKLSADARYLFIYLLTCQFVSLTSYFEISRGQIKEDTGLENLRLKKAIDELEKHKRAFFYEGWVFIPNLDKHNPYWKSPKTEKAYKEELNSIPKYILDYFKNKIDSSIYSSINTTINTTPKTENINNKTEIMNHNKEIESMREREKETIHNSLDYLINEEELKKDYLNRVFSKYNVSFTEVKRKAEELYNYCQAKGKRYKNYQRFLINALIRDFGYKFNQ